MVAARSHADGHLVGPRDRHPDSAASARPNGQDRSVDEAERLMGAVFDFAVIGGGLVGAALARGLAREGLRVCVLDEGDVAYRASRGNFALVWLQSKGINMPAYANWTRRSVDLWPAYAAELESETGIDVSLQQEGGFHLALSDGEMERLVIIAGRVNGQPGVIPYPYSVLDGDEVRRRLPG